MATDPSNADTVRRNASNSSTDAAWRATRAGMTLASVVIGPAMRSECAERSSAWLSTSPLSTPTTNGGRAPPGCSSSSLFTGWALGSDTMPTLAQRVWPNTATWARSPASASRSSASDVMASRITRVLSPSSPISAAAL